MRKIMFVGRSESGKTTLTQAMKGKKIIYHKTQYVNHYDVIIDTPGFDDETVVGQKRVEKTHEILSKTDILYQAVFILR